MQEENSSSPNVNLYIVEIKEARGNKTRLFLSNDETFIINKVVLTEEQVYPGQRITENELNYLQYRSALFEAERIALNLVSRQLHSKLKLKQKLIKKNFSSEIIDQIEIKFEKAGLLNDFEYARAWILDRIQASPEGKRKLFVGLLRRGISQDIANQIISEEITDEIEEQCVEKIIFNLSRYKKLEKEILAQKLFTKGFSKKTIDKVLN